MGREVEVGICAEKEFVPSYGSELAAGADVHEVKNRVGGGHHGLPQRRREQGFHVALEKNP